MWNKNKEHIVTYWAWSRMKIQSSAASWRQLQSNYYKTAHICRRGKRARWEAGSWVKNPLFSTVSAYLRLRDYYRRVSRKPIRARLAEVMRVSYRWHGNSIHDTAPMWLPKQDLTITAAMRQANMKRGDCTGPHPQTKSYRELVTDCWERQNYSFQGWVPESGIQWQVVSPEFFTYKQCRL